MSTRKAFMTGATGFVGLNTVKVLKEQNWDVTALVRPTSETKWLKPFGVTLAAGTILDPQSLMLAIPEGTDTLFHIAGNTALWAGHAEEQTRDNVAGTHNVVEAALKKGVRRLVVTSSIAAWGDIDGEVTETRPQLGEHSISNYSRTKWQAEQIAKTAVSRGLEVVVLNPAAIIGPYDFGNWSRMFMMVKAGKLPGVPPGANAFAHVTEVAKAHVAAADRGTNGGNYILGGTPATYLSLIQGIAELVGAPKPAKTTPAAVLRLGGAAMEFLSRFTGKEPSMTKALAVIMTKTVTAPSSLAIAELGYAAVPLAQMLKDCYDWLVAEGRLA